MSKEKYWLIVQNEKEKSFDTGFSLSYYHDKTKKLNFFCSSTRRATNSGRALSPADSAHKTRPCDQSPNPRPPTTALCPFTGASEAADGADAEGALKNDGDDPQKTPLKQGELPTTSAGLEPRHIYCSYP
jgi:hypothetical protein